MSHHPELETLAQLAEGSLPAEAASAVRRHLAGCRSCTASYADAVRYRAAWLASPEMFQASREARREVAAADRASRRAPPGAAGRSGRSQLVGVIAAAAALVMGALWAYRTTHAPTLRFDLPPDVRAATEWASARGLVLPGGERLANEAPHAIRSGLAEPDPGVERELDSLTTAYERGRFSPGVGARVVAALLAANDVAAARDYAREGLRRHPDDVRLLVLSAAASYRFDDLAAAETSLRRASSGAPGDPMVALDLALVLRQRGQLEEARGLLERVARGRHPELAARAQRELLLP